MMDARDGSDFLEIKGSFRQVVEKDLVFPSAHLARHFNLSYQVQVRPKASHYYRAQSSLARQLREDCALVLVLERPIPILS